MRIANLILNIFSQLIALVSISIPFMMAFMLGTIGLMFYDSPKADQEIIEGSWLFVLICIVTCVFVIVSFVFGIVACVKGKKAKTKTYITLQSIAMVFALISNALAIGMYVFINDLIPIEGMEDIHLLPSFGIGLVIVTLVLTIIYGCTRKSHSSSSSSSSL